MNFHHNLLRNKKGIGTVFGMVFFLLIVMIVFASFVIILNQNTGLEQVTINAKQMDLDRYTELSTVSIANPETAVLNNVVYLLCDITNNGTLPTEFTRLWIRDITNGTVGNLLLRPSLVIQPGSSIEYFKSVPVLNASNNDQFSFWFVTTRGNLISAYPNINQFSGISTIGASSGQNSNFANTAASITLYINSTKPNDLIYLAVVYDDGNTLNPPASNPILNWAIRTTSDSTDQYTYGGYGGYGGTTYGDAFLRTYYAFSPGGPINITLSVSGTENQDYYWAAIAFAVSNVNVASPFDNSGPQIPGPQSTTGPYSPAHDTINTGSSNELVIGAFEIDTLTPQITPGAGFTQVLPAEVTAGANGDSDAIPRSVWVETSVIPTHTNNLAVTCTYIATNRPWAIVVDAVNLVVTPPVVPVSLSPSSGPIGQPVTVSGGGFAANSRLIATFDGSQVPFSFTTDGSGNIPPNAIFNVPQGSTVGNKTVTIIDSKFNYASANFTVTTSGITVTPQIGPVGTTVTVTGSNFIDNSTININFDGNPIGTATANPTGGFSTTFVVSGTAGNKTVLASDGVNSVYSSFTVIPSIVITPSRGLNGTQVTISGQGFAAQSNLMVTFDGIAVSTSGNPSTDATGSFSNVIFTAQSPTLGVKFVNVTDASGNSDNDTFKLVALDHFNIAGYPTSVTAGQSFGSNNVIVTACDVDGYVLNGYVGQVYFSSSDSHAILPNNFANKYTFTTNDGGVHTFAGSAFTLKTAGSEILTVTDGTRSSSTTIVVNPAALDHFTFNAINSPQVPGTGFSITITAKDIYENTVTSYVSSNGLTVSTGTISPLTTGVFVSGTKTVSVTLTGAGTGVTIGTTGGSPVKAGTSNAFIVNPGALHHFTMTGVPGSVTAGQVFGSVVVTAYDANNNVKTDYVGSVYFTSTDVAAVLPYTSSSTYMFTSGSGLDNGVHSFAGFALKTVGSMTITVTTGATSLTSGAITVGFAPIDHFAVTGFTNPVVAGTAGSVTVTAKDPYGNTVTTYTGTVHITSSDGAAVLPADHALASGASSFTVTLKTVGAQSVTATDTSTGLITGSQTAITVTPAVLDHFTFASISSPQTAGASFGVSVTANDLYGNTVTSYVSSTSLTESNGGTVTPASVTFVGGQWSGSVVLSKSGAGVSISATGGGKSGSSNTFTVNPGALDHFTMTGYPSPVTAGASFGTNVVVTAFDVYNNVKTDYAGSIYFTSSDLYPAVLPFTSGSVYTFTVGTGLDNGVHTFAGSGFVLKTTTSQTITVRDDAAGKLLTSSAITVTPAVLDHFTFASISSPQTAGTAFSVTITAKDVYENTVTSYVSSNGLTVSTGTISPLTTGVFVSGTKTVSVTLTGAGTGVTIGTTGGSPVKAGTSNSINVNPGVLDHFTFSAISTPQTAGTAITGITITALDANGNTATSYSGSTILTETNGGAGGSVLESPVTFVSGVWSGSLTVTKSGSGVTITATGGGKSVVSNAFTVNPGVLAKFAFATISAQTAGTAFSITVTAQDANGNTVTGYSSSVPLSVSVGTISPLSTGTSGWSGSVWSGSVTLTGAGSGVTITANDGSGHSGVSNGFTVNPGALDHFTIGSVSSPQVAGTAFSVTITAYDANNNVKTNYAGTATLTCTAGSGSIAPGSVSSWSSGVASLLVTVSKTGTGVSITAADSGHSGVSNGFTVNPGALDHFTIGSVSSPQVAGTAFSVTITAYDANNNVKTNYAGSGTATLSDLSATISPASLGSGWVGGVWTSSSVMITKTYTNDVITAKDGTPTGSSGQFTVAPGALDHFTVTASGGGNIGAQIVYTPFSITVTAYDASNNVKTNYAGPATLSDLATALSPTSTGTFTSGAVTLSVTITHSYTNDKITATSGSSTGQSNQFTVSVRPLALDGSTSGIGTNTITLTLATSNPNDILYLSVTEHSSESVTSVTSAGLSWTPRATATNSGQVKVETWYATRPTSGSTTITITLNSNSYGNTAVAFGIAGADIANPFDGSYVTGTGSGTTASTSKTTNNANDFIIGATAVDNTPTITAGSSFNLVATQAYPNLRENSVEYRGVSTAGAYTASFTLNQNNYWAMIIDAVNQAS